MFVFGTHRQCMTVGAIVALYAGVCFPQSSPAGADPMTSGRRVAVIAPIPQAQPGARTTAAAKRAPVDLISKFSADIAGFGSTKAGLSAARAAYVTTTRLFGEESLQGIVAAAGLAYSLMSQGANEEAEQLLKKTIAIARRRYPPGKPVEGHRALAVCLDHFGRLCELRNDFRGAMDAARESLALRRALLGDQNLETVESLEQLGHLYVELADCQSAEPLLLQAAESARVIVGKDHRAYGLAVGILADMYELKGAFVLAERLRRQTLEVARKTVGEEHTDFARELNALAILYIRQGDDSKAEPLLRKALAVREQALGETNMTNLPLLLNLAIAYQMQGLHEKAEATYRRAMEIIRKSGTEGQLNHAWILTNLGTLYLEQGRNNEAELLLKQASTMWKDAVGPSHPRYAYVLRGLAVLCARRGDFEQAEALERRSLDISKQSVGETHPEHARSLYGLADVEFTRGRYSEAELHCRQALNIHQELLELTTVARSERRQIMMCKLFFSTLELYLSISVAAGTAPQDAYQRVLEWKGRVFLGQLVSRASRSQPELVPLFSRLDATNAELTHLFLSTPDPSRQQARLEKLHALSDEKDRLEGELSSRSSEFRKSRQPIGVRELRQALPGNAAVVDLLEYAHSSPQAFEQGQFKNEMRLTAFVIRKNAPVVRIDLGNSDAVAKAVENWRRTYGRSPTSDPGGELRRLLWMPLSLHLKGAETIYFSPDGVVSFFPLAALPGSRPGAFLIEERNVVVLPVPRLLPELLASPKSDRSHPSALLVGNVDFGCDPGATSLAETNAGTRGSSSSAARGAGANHYAPLPGTEQELREIDQLYRRCFSGGAPQRLAGDQATEHAFRTRAPQQRWIHLATHGFFAAEEVHSALEGVDRNQKHPDRMLAEPSADVRGFHPGLLSGIALAGANRGNDSASSAKLQPNLLHDDGIVTALEVENLDLARTDLVVLSACETGLGRIAGGEGVLGLQRAFQVAGAKNVIASLWKVDDQATAALMRLFYHKLWSEKKPPAVALRESQLALLHHPDLVGSLAGTRGADFNKVVELVDKGARSSPQKQADPRLWAGFVISGSGN